MFLRRCDPIICCLFLCNGKYNKITLRKTTANVLLKTYGMYVKIRAKVPIINFLKCEYFLENNLAFLYIII